ncbi:hypothetical protein [Lelliottia sp. JS-SCA-14]|uniref:hypothetical protein n=1 Tax=Lelliottia sp. JS-SCA-14 TaxID=3110110 RepID=UPI002D7883A8|nr:hypothetical protein [Lelliottia sp. JS-SCA-14]
MMNLTKGYCMRETMLNRTEIKLEDAIQTNDMESIVEIVERYLINKNSVGIYNEIDIRLHMLWKHKELWLNDSYLETEVASKIKIMFEKLDAYFW